METAYLLMDVGGTEIKCGISDGAGRMLVQEKFPADAKAGQEEILSHFAQIIEALVKMAGNCAVGGVGMAFPGPFDYVNGISLMRGLDKYDSIYGVPIAEEIQRRVPVVRNVKFKFLHDVEAFAVGVSRFGLCSSKNKIFCLCIGTGAGSAFVQAGRAIKSGKGVPENGWIYNTPFKETIIDDYVSVRGLKAASQRILGEMLDGKQLYDLCVSGDAAAMKVYESFGCDIAAAAEPFIKCFCPDALVLGGQISGSFEFFGKELLEICKSYGTEVYLEKDTSIRAMQGLFAVMTGGDCDVKS